ncbi:MAG: hypothetical protein JXR78_15605 [Victivallales bacterium]|nr:hypothetical protein [Victivallales bacterium]
MSEFFNDSDPYFLILSFVMGLGLIYTFGSSIWESIHLYCKFRKYASKLPAGDFIPSESLCEVLDMSPERLKELNGKPIMPRYEAEKIIKEMISKEWW